MTGSTHDPEDPSAVARVCYISAMVYAAFIAFCGCQVSPPFFAVEGLSADALGQMMSHKRYPRGVQL
jgi:hypothetical protein